MWVNKKVEDELKIIKKDLVDKMPKLIKYNGIIFIKVKSDCIIIYKSASNFY